MNYEERYALGREIRNKVLDTNHTGEPANKFQAAFRQFTEENCWGTAWVRPGLEHKTRSMLNLAMLAVMARWKEFEVHVRGARNTGVTDDEMIEIVIQAGVYAGVPIAAESMRIVERVMSEPA
ncbi:MAG: carboxymuconolactone decarboxylase family protein [Rhodospirillales bacterium]